MGHLHTKTMNRLQSALLEHDFVIQYKKGEIMPADYLSRLPSADVNHLADITQCFDPRSNRNSLTCKKLIQTCKK